MSRRGAWALAWLSACASDPEVPAPDPALPDVAAALRSTPDDRAGVLVELAPLPDPAIVAVYDVHGPGGLVGTLEILAATGGLRRENWNLRLPVAGRDVELTGSRVRTPDAVWQARDGAPGRVVPARLGTVADAIVALDPTLRTRVVDEIRTWRAELSAAQREHPGDVEMIAGLPCVRVPVGAGDVCTWEDTGLPLRYAGPSFTVVAKHVDRDAVLGASAFAIPADAARVDAPPFDVLAPVAAVAKGDRAAIAALVLADDLPDGRGLLP